MIDIENEVFTRVSQNLKAEFPDISTSQIYERTPASFPFVHLEEQDNYDYTQTMTNCKDNHVYLMYEVNIYSNKRSGKKAECKKILSNIDNTMKNMGFRRTGKRSIPNINDATIYRMLARYVAVVDKNKIIYRG